MNEGEPELGEAEGPVRDFAPQRELLIVALGLALLGGGLFLAGRIDGCRPWYWLLPLTELAGGAAIAGYAGSWPVRTVGFLAVLCSFPIAFVVLVCGGLGPG